MTKSMRIELEGGFIGQSSDPKAKRLMFPWTGTQGPIINGKLIVNHRDDLTFKALTLTFTAKISCSWSEHRLGSTVHYSAKKPLLEKNWVFLAKSDAKLHLLHANQTYTYDFQLALPVNLPNSLSMSTGKTEYLFTANCKRSAFQTDLYADQLVEIYQSLPSAHPHCIYPLHQTADFENALNYLVQIPRKAFHHGAVIPITVRINPLPGTGARWRVLSMDMKIKEYFWFISPGKGMKHEKRTLVESSQGSGSWPVQTSPVERTLSISVPAYNVMSTVDTEVIKCTHRLKVLLTIDINGSSKKIAVDFDIYIPGPFPPGQGPVGATPQQQPQPQLQYQQVPIQPYVQTQAQHQILQQQPVIQGVPYPSQPQPQSQPPQPQQQQYHHMQPAAQQHPPLPVSTQQQYSAQPYPMPLQTSIITSASYPLSAQTPTTVFAQTSPLSPQTSHHTQQTSFPAPPAPLPATPGSTPGMSAATAASHPYSQGYPTPTASHTYPVATSSQGYPTPKLPSMPSPTVPTYPLPPSPVPGYVPSHSTAAPPSGPTCVAMSVPPPTLAAAHTTAADGSFSSPGAHPGTPVMAYQHQHYQAATPKFNSPKVLGNGPPPLQVDDTIKVSVPNIDDSIKVNLDDIKIPSTPSTPATLAASSHSKNPQLRLSAHGGSAGEIQQQKHSSDAFLSFSAVPTQPHAPHAIKPEETDDSQFSYKPPPPSLSTATVTTTVTVPATRPAATTAGTSSTVNSASTVNIVSTSAASPNHNSNPYAVAAAAAAATSQQHDLSHQFSQMGFTALPPPSTPTFSSAASPTPSYTQPPSPSVRPGISSQVSMSSYPNQLSPVSAAATGAVVASQQYQQQQQVPPPPSTPTSYHPSMPSMLQSQGQPQPQPMYHQQQQQQQHLQQLQRPRPPPKQQVWIPVYQTLNGKTYVQYKPGA